MIRKQAFGGLSVLGLVVFCAAVADTGQLVGRASAGTFTAVADRDNTLFEYPRGGQTTINSNSEGNQLGVGRTKSANQIQRGLLHFPIRYDSVENPGGIPDDAIISNVTVRLRLIDRPNSDENNTRPFWLVALDQSHFATGDDWGEGTSQVDGPGSSTGSGAPAMNGDATWWHSEYILNDHGQNTNPDPFPTFGTDGFWREMGALGSNAANDAYVLSRDPEAIVGGSIHADYRDFYYFLSTTEDSPMVDDMQAWVDGSVTNYGWVVLGDESVFGTDDSSKRVFASSENISVDSGNGWSYQPTLIVEYTVGAAVPEPSACLLALIGLILASGCVRRRKR